MDYLNRLLSDETQSKMRANSVSAKTGLFTLWTLFHVGTVLRAKTPKYCAAVTQLTCNMQSSNNVVIVLQSFLDDMEHEVKTNPNFKGQLGTSRD